MSRAVVLLSGGIDSAAALAWARQKYEELIAISFQYHLRPFRERAAVYRLLQHFPARLFEVPLPFLKEASDANHHLASTAPQGYISNRNIIFYSIAAYYAEMNHCSVIVGGHTAEDQDAFPDAGAKFLDKLQELANEALLFGTIHIELPLIQMSKLQVLEKALQWNVPLHYTWSCYWDAPSPCGKCTSCIERAEAFAKLGAVDPL